MPPGVGSTLTWHLLMSPVSHSHDFSLLARVHPPAFCCLLLVKTVFLLIFPLDYRVSLCFSA